VFANVCEYHDGVFKIVLEWNICISVLGDYGDI
jgi:hypothetical protein